MKVPNLNFSEIKEGDIYLFEKNLSEENVMGFAKITGDFNPLHVDVAFGRKSQFKSNIVHGMLAASLFSTLVGMYCPGEKSIYLTQTLNFKAPIFYNESVFVKGTVLAKNDAIKVITLKTEIIKEGKVMINGEAKVRMVK